MSANSLPESVLIWSTAKPEFEEIRGKSGLVYEYDDPPYTNVKKWFFNIRDKMQYDVYFTDHFEKFAIIADPEIEPLALWGVEPIVGGGYGTHAISWEIGEMNSPKRRVILVYGATESAAITAWNRIAEKLGEVAI